MRKIFPMYTHDVDVRYYIRLKMNSIILSIKTKYDTPLARSSKQSLPLNLSWCAKITDKSEKPSSPPKEEEEHSVENKLIFLYGCCPSINKNLPRLLGLGILRYFLSNLGNLRELP